MTTTAPPRMRTSFDNYKLSLSNAGAVESGRSARRISSSVRTSIRPTLQNPTQVRSERVSISKLTKRQFFIIVLVAISVLAIMLPATTAFGRRSLVSSERPTAEVQSSVVSVVVHQGDTLWSIARKLEPNRDPREIIDQLVSTRGTASVYVGETIEWTR